MVIRERNETDNNGEDSLSVCESITKNIKQNLKFKSIRRAIGFACIISIVYYQQINLQNFQEMIKVLNVTTNAFDTVFQ